MTAAEHGKVVTHRLDNGLRVTIVEDHDAPVVGVAVHVGVGFRSEPAGRSGFAHLFEHLMFQGGADSPRDHFHEVESVGGRCNGSTRQDYTDFYTVAPADTLAHLLEREAARMRAPSLTEQAIRAQVGVVTEEILTKTHRPYGGFPWPLISPVLFRSYPNAHDGYGDHAALADVTVADCEEFFTRHYAPGNAVLTVTGDVHVDRTLEEVERSFGRIAPRPVPRLGPWWEPDPTGPVAAEHRDRFAALPAVALGYRVPDPAAGLRPLVAHATLADILVGGPRSRLANQMGEAGRKVGPLSARCGLFDFADARDPEIWIFTAVHPAATSRAEVLEVFDADLRRLATEGPPADQLARAVARRIDAHYRSMDQIANRVRALGRFGVLFDDPGLADTLPDLYRQVTADDVADAARQLAHDGRAVLTLVPATDGSGSMTPDYHDRTLANGLRVLALRKGTGPLVEVRLHIPAPAFTARRVAEQTMLVACVAARHPAGRTAAATPAAAAAELGAWADYRRVGLACGSAVGGLDAALRIVSDAVAGVSVTNAEYETERAQQVTRVRMLRAHPDTATRIELTRRLFAGHPVTTQVPDVVEIAAVSAADVRRAAEATLRPNGATLVIVGSDEPARSADLADSLLGGWPAGDPQPAMPPLPSPPPGDVHLVPIPGAARAQIRLRALAVPSGDPRYAALMLVSNLLGSGTSSRLARDLREDKGYVYGLSCCFEPVPGGMMIALEADTATATAVPTFEALVAQLRLLRTSPPTPDEIDAARRRALGATAIGFASRTATASSLAEMAAVGADPLSLFGLAERLRAVVPDAVHDAAGFFAPDRFAGVVAGDLPATTRLGP